MDAAVVNLKAKKDAKGNRRVKTKLSTEADYSVT